MLFATTPKFVPAVPKYFSSNRGSSPIRSEFVERIYPLLKENPNVWLKIIESSTNFSKVRSNFTSDFTRKYNLQFSERTTGKNAEGKNIGDLYVRYVN